MASSRLAQPAASSARPSVAAAALAVACVGTAFGIVQQPWLLTGAVAGAVVLAVAISAPMALVGMMLVLGAIDLSFMTGGFKALFPQLGGLDMNGIRLVGASIGFTVFILTAPHTRTRMMGQAGFAYFAFLAYAGLSLLNSFDPLEGLRLLLKLAYPLLTCLLVIALCDTREKLEALTKWTLIAAAVLFLIVNPLLALAGVGQVDVAGFTRVRGISGSANSFSFYGMAMIFIAFTRLIYRKQKRYLFLCILAGVWLTLAMTRITFLATIVGLLAISMLAAAAQRQYRAVAIGMVVILAVGLPGLPFILDRSLGYVPGPSELFALLTDPIGLYQAINWQGRTNLWPIVWTGFMAAPVLGLGLGSSGVVIREHFPAEAASVAHNEYLRLAADTGVVGVLLFMAAMFSWLATTLRAGMRLNTEVAQYAVPAVASLIAWGIIAITDNPFDSYMYYTQYVGFLVGGTIALQSIVTREEEAGYTARA